MSAVVHALNLHPFVPFFAFVYAGGQRGVRGLCPTKLLSTPQGKRTCNLVCAWVRRGSWWGPSYGSFSSHFVLHHSFVSGVAGRDPYPNSLRTSCHQVLHVCQSVRLAYFWNQQCHSSSFVCTIHHQRHRVHHLAHVHDWRSCT